MSENFYLDNPDIRFHLTTLDMEEAVRIRENDYKEAAEFSEAPENYADAIDSYDKVLAMVGEITGDHIAPRARDVDIEGAHLENGVVSYAKGTDLNLRALTEAELMGVTLPRKYNGLNMPVTLYSMMNEMVSRADASLQNLFGLQDIAETINRYGDEKQKASYLPRFASGEVDGAMALTEPEAGSDLQAVQLKATLDAATGIWYLNGMKRFITNGCAKALLVLARSEEGSKDGRGLSMFVCERTPDLIVRRIESKLGIHGSPTCELQFNNVPAELVGERRRGLTRYVMSLMNGARVAISAQGLGVAEAAYRGALEYARAREQFGKTIDKIPAVYEMLVGMKVKVAAARTLLYESTRYVDLRDSYETLIEHQGKDATTEARQAERKYSKIAAELTPLAKGYCTEIANQVAYDNIQVHGGTGFMRDFNAERYYRDARITNIYEGTTQLQVVAAIGGVMQRILDPIMSGFSHLPYEGKLRRLASSVDVAHGKILKAVQYVQRHTATEYFDIMARRLVEMETIVLISYLMLRDAMKDKRREPLVERYILDNMPIVDTDFTVVTSGDFSLVDRHNDILAL